MQNAKMTALRFFMREEGRKEGRKIEVDPLRKEVGKETAKWNF